METRPDLEHISWHQDEIQYNSHITLELYLLLPTIPQHVPNTGEWTMRNDNITLPSEDFFKLDYSPFHNEKTQSIFFKSVQSFNSAIQKELDK